MATQLLNLPVNIPWKQIAVSPDMIDTDFGNKRFPFAWRSSLAISTYEPKLEDLPEELCKQRITYLKITCSITGYQPDAEETRIGIASFSDLPEEEQARIQRILEEESYFACYGVLLNVAVFPLETLPIPGSSTNIQNFPHIIALEPKVRDFYQAATESGEILTGSKSGVSTDKTLTHIDSSESSTSFEASVQIPINEAEVGLTGSTRLTNTTTDQDQWSVQTDASRERRETQGTTTQLSQMYNLLTGYHQGTNRATFLMLPRPHVLQPTDRRTFVQGLRQIEGIQEFMLIVSRPEGVPGLCVEAFLETAHFPDGVEVVEPGEEYYETQTDRTVTAFADNSWFSQNCEKIESDETATIVLSDPNWVIDSSKGDPGHPGITEQQDESNGQALETLDNYNYQAISETTVKVTGRICGSRLQGDKARFKRNYRIHLRSIVPKNSQTQPQADIDKLLITSRGLQVCIKSTDDCPIVVDSGELPPIDDGVFELSVVDERLIRIPPSLITREAASKSRMPAMKRLLHEIQKTLSGGWRFQSRYPAGEVGFLDTEYFKDQVKKVLPHERLETPLADVRELPEEVIKSLGERTTVSQILEMDLESFAKKTDLSLAEAAKMRRVLLGINPKQKGYDKVD